MIGKIERAACLTLGCEGDPHAAGAAKGWCPRCYQRERRRALGVKVRSTPIAAPGEGDEVTFCLPRPEKERMVTLARKFRLASPSELYRQIVRAFLELSPELQQGLGGNRKSTFAWDDAHGRQRRPIYAERTS